MVELYILEREREQAEAAWEGRWQKEFRRMRRAERQERRATGGPVAWLRGLFTRASQPPALDRG
jgi:hypothetical protein